MKVVDSSGWLEYFAQGPNAGFFAPAIQDTDSLVVPTICVYEVFKLVLAQRGEEAALQAAGIMSLGTSANLTPEIALQAAHISLDLKMAMADSMILATSQAYNAALWTQDADFEGLAGVVYIEKQP
jgi:predicted nucleic acid-binding protein